MMIVFCEDCGKKNHLDNGQIIDGKAVFICKDCGYPNAYGLEAFSTRSNTALEQLFSTLQEFPDIMGGFLFHKKKGVTRTRMPEILKPEDIETLGAHLTQTYEFGQDAWPKIQEMVALISDKYFFVHKIGSRSYAVITGVSPVLPQTILTCIANLQD